jgi:hypothetical protein
MATDGRVEHHCPSLCTSTQFVTARAECFQLLVDAWGWAMRPRLVVAKPLVGLHNGGAAVRPACRAHPYPEISTKFGKNFQACIFNVRRKSKQMNELCFGIVSGTSNAIRPGITRE